MSWCQVIVSQTGKGQAEADGGPQCHPHAAHPLCILGKAQLFSFQMSLKNTAVETISPRVLGEALPLAEVCVAAAAPLGHWAHCLQGDTVAGLPVFHPSPVQALPSSSSCNPLLNKPCFFWFHEACPHLLSWSLCLSGLVPEVLSHLQFITSQSCCCSPSAPRRLCCWLSCWPRTTLGIKAAPAQSQERNREIRRTQGLILKVSRS